MVAINRSVGGVWEKKRPSAIAASSSSVIDTVPLTGFRSLDYIITVWNTTEDKTKSQHYKVTQDASGLKSIVRDKLGTKLNISISESIVSGKIELTVTNNESFLLEIQIARLRLG